MVNRVDLLTGADFVPGQVIIKAPLVQKGIEGMFRSGTLYRRQLGLFGRVSLHMKS